jgi:Tol biopolymer transport system component
MDQQKEIAVMSHRREKPYFMRCVLAAGLLLLAIGRFSASFAEDGRIPVFSDDIIGPVQITASPDTVFDMAVCGKSRQIIYITGEDKPTTIWLAPLDPSDAAVPRRLVAGNSEKTSPALSPDGRYAAFVGTDYDVKGDIFIMDLDADAPRPIRLTGRETEDGGPAFPATAVDSIFINPHRT